MKNKKACRLLTAKYELGQKLYKAFCKDSDLPSDMRDRLRYKLSKLPRNSSFARVRNQCISTGRPRSVYEFFRISRIVFHGLASRGPLISVTREEIQLVRAFSARQKSKGERGSLPNSPRAAEIARGLTINDNG